MKKTVLGMLAGAAFMLTLASCGEKLLTDEQVTAEIQKGFDLGKPAIESEMNTKCDTEFEANVTMELDRLKAEYEAGQSATGSTSTVPSR